METPIKNKILLIEDDTTFVDLLRNKCIDAGLSVFVAENGEQGIKIASEEHPDVIITDLTMPVMDGFEFLKQLHTHSWGKKVPVIILSNYGDFDRISKALENGAFQYLIKGDIDPQDVLLHIQQALKKTYH